MSTEIVKSVSIENLLARRSAIVERFTNARALLVEAKELCDSVADLDIDQLLQSRHSHHGVSLLERDAVKLATERLDAALWGHLMHESGLRSFMDATARETWDKSIHEAKTPALTQENIAATFAQLYAVRGDMFERGVIEVFRGLSWNYKSNLPHKFGKRIVVGRFMDCYGSVSGYARSDRLSDLERCMYMLDGKPAPDHRQGIVQQCGEIQRQWIRSSNFKREAEDDYFRVRWFKNGNGHFYFKRPDLIERMNGIIAKHYPGALPELI
jgi:hypothetical protein